MAEYVAGKGTTALGIIGTALGGLATVGGNLGNLTGTTQQYITKESFDLQTKVSSLESKNALLEAGISANDKINCVRDEIMGYITNLERTVSNNAASQSVINANVGNGMTALSGQVNTIQGIVNEITKVAIPSTSVVNFTSSNGG